jgi:hypothetical protein
MAARGSNGAYSLKSSALRPNPNERSGRSMKNVARLAKVQRWKKIVALLGPAKYKMSGRQGS